MTALARYRTKIDSLAERLYEVSLVLINMRDTTGDLHVSQLQDYSVRLGRLKAAGLEALTEMLKAPAEAEQYMLDINGPATIADFQAKLVSIETATTAWNNECRAMLDEHDTSMKYVTIGTGDTAYAYPEFDFVIPGATANPRRASAALATLITEVTTFT